MNDGSAVSLWSYIDQVLGGINDLLVPINNGIFFQMLT